MAATPKPVRKVAKTIKYEHRKTRSTTSPTTYGKVKKHVEKRREKNLPLSSVKNAAEFRLKERQHAHAHMKAHGG